MQNTPQIICFGAMLKAGSCSRHTWEVVVLDVVPDAVEGYKVACKVTSVHKVKR